MFSWISLSNACKMNGKVFGGRNSYASNLKQLLIVQARRTVVNSRCSRLWNPRQCLGHCSTSPNTLLLLQCQISSALEAWWASHVNNESWWGRPIQTFRTCLINNPVFSRVPPCVFTWRPAKCAHSKFFWPRSTGTWKSRAGDVSESRKTTIGKDRRLLKPWESLFAHGSRGNVL